MEIVETSVEISGINVIPQEIRVKVPREREREKIAINWQVRYIVEGQLWGLKIPQTIVDNHTRGQSTERW
ncbi:hypothetical protein ANTPLA_LOCUS429 [Anthophora plagiata]